MAVAVAVAVDVKFIGLGTTICTPREVQFFCFVHSLASILELNNHNHQVIEEEKYKQTSNMYVWQRN